MRCRHFKIFELVPKDLHEKYEEYKLWWLFDDRVLITLDMLRDQYGHMLMNNWNRGGDRDEAGYRVSSTTTGAPFSQHKFGRAADPKFLDMPVGVVRQDCIDRKYDCFKYITAIELGVNWFHFDVRNTDSEQLLTFKP